MQENIFRIGKNIKYIWETFDVITLVPLVGVNTCQPIMQMSKRMIYLYATDEQINQFSIGYMINPFLHIKRRSDNKLRNS